MCRVRSSPSDPGAKVVARTSDPGHESPDEAGCCVGDRVDRLERGNETRELLAIEWRDRCPDIELGDFPLWIRHGNTVNVRTRQVPSDQRTHPEVPMPTRDEGGQKSTTRRTEEVEEVEEVASSDVQERHEALTDDVDDILDEIDSVLESNAEDFVRQYVQKGGE